MPVRVRSRGLQRRSVRHADLSWRAQAMLEALGLEDAELSVLLCSDEEIRQLNRRYRRKDKSTDVLAFPMQELPFRAPAGALLGDVVISLPTAARQAAEGDRPIIEEVTFLLAHGLLHLVGYDHATKRQEREMTERIAHLLASVEDARR
ncbi:MAG: rRNA maturation RNase YbeY [Myxococcales bacterium]|nr:rRNA maturation RNase YbeY [Myxococcales bacterium]